MNCLRGYQTYGFHTNSKFIRVIAQGLKKLPKGTRYNLGRKIGKMKKFPWTDPFI